MRLLTDSCDTDSCNFTAKFQSWIAVSVVMLLSLASFQPVKAAFLLVDDFQSYTTGIEIHGQSDGSGTWETSNAGDYLADNDQTTPGNKVLNVLNTIGTGGQHEAVLNDPKINIADGTVGTFFFRFWRGDSSSDVIWGLIDETAPANIDDLGWGDFRTNLRNSVTEQNGVTVGEPGRRSNLDARNASPSGNSFGNADIDPLPEGEWFNMWLVVHNDGNYAPLNFLNETADYTEIYIQSDVSFPVQTQLATLAGAAQTPDTKFTFGWDTTNPPAGPPTSGTDAALDRFFMRNCCGTTAEELGLENNHVGPWYLDDIYIDTNGQNLANPIPIVPEPSTVVLSLVGLFGLTFSSLRRRST